MPVQQRRLLHKFLLLQWTSLLCNNNKYSFILELILLDIPNMNNLSFVENHKTFLLHLKYRLCQTSMCHDRTA
jgi:hypothetical protein